MKAFFFLPDKFHTLIREVTLESSASLLRLSYHTNHIHILLCLSIYLSIYLSPLILTNSHALGLIKLPATYLLSEVYPSLDVKLRGKKEKVGECDVIVRNTNYLPTYLPRDPTLNSRQRRTDQQRAGTGIHFIGRAYMYVCMVIIKVVIPKRSGREGYSFVHSFTIGA